MHIQQMMEVIKMIRKETSQLLDPLCICNIIHTYLSFSSKYRSCNLSPIKTNVSVSKLKQVLKNNLKDCLLNFSAQTNF